MLEHLEDPVAYLRSLFAMIRPGGYAYVAAALNAGHVDHIYLYRSPAEIEAQLVQVGFKIIEQRSELAYSGKPIDITPCHAGFFLQPPLISAHD